MKKSNPDSSMIGDLLKKLHASYFGDKKETEKQTKKKAADTDDAELLGQLKATLDKASAPESQGSPDEKKKKKTSKKTLHSAPPPSKQETAADAPNEEADIPAVADDALPAEQEPALPDAKEEKKPAPKKRAKKETSPAKKYKPPRAPEAEAPAVEIPSEEPDVLAPAKEELLQETVEVVAEEPLSEEISSDVTELPVEEIESDVAEPFVEETDSTEETIEQTPTGSAPAPRKKMIVKRIKEQTIARPEVPAPKKSTPGVTVPHLSDAYDFSKEKIPEEDAPIVIRPKAPKSPVRSESIVIRPRVSDYTPPRPTYDDASTTSSPITIEVMQEKKKQMQEAPASEPFASDTPATESTHAPIKKKKAVTTVRQVKKTAPVKTAEVFTEDREDLIEVLDTEPTAELFEEPALQKAEEPTPVAEPEETAKVPAPKKVSAFQRRQQHKQGRTKKSAPVSEIIHERSGLTDDDIAMMFELGYENELGKLVGYETMKKLRYEHLRRSSHSSHVHYHTAFGYRGEEYMGAQQNEAVLAAYSHDKRKLIHRLILSVLISVILFFIERPMPAGSAIASLFEKLPILALLIAILLLIGSALLCRRELLAGVRSLIRFSPTPYSIGVFAVALALVYSIVGLILPDSLTPFNFLASLFPLFMTACDVLRVCTELRAFRILSVSAEKTVLEVASPRKKKLRHSDRIVKVINDDVALNLYRVRTADQTTGFFRRFNSMTGFAAPVSIFTGISLAAAFLASFVTALLTASVGAAAQAMLAVFFVSLPATLVLNCFYPLYRANKQLSRWNCTLVGEEAVNDFAKDLTVIFDDTDLYRIERCTRVSMRESDDLRQDIKLVEVLFRKLGGTLGSLGGKPHLNDPPVSIVRVASNGVEAVVDSKAHILLGSTDFLRKNGIRVPRESADATLYRPPHTAMMYAAIDGTLKLSYEVEYRNNTEFEDTITILASDGDSVSIHSHDPNLTDDFLRNSRRGYEDPISVTRPARFDPNRVEEVADTGAVALGSKETIALPLHAAKEIRAVRRRGFYLQLIASLLGIASASVLTFLGYAGWITPISLTLYQLLWLTVSVVHTRASLSRLRLYL